MAATELPNGWTFQEPPESQRGGARDYSPLMEHPGRWVLIDAHAGTPSAGSQMKTAAAKKHGGKWEGRTVVNKALREGRKTWRAYLRYVGAE